MNISWLLYILNVVWLSMYFFVIQTLTLSVLDEANILIMHMVSEEFLYEVNSDSVQFYRCIIY